MSKKHKHGKKDRREAGSLEMSVPQLLVLERQMCAEKNWRRLVEVAKQLIRKGDGGARERLARYYLQRALELQQKGLPAEGAMLLDNIAAPLEQLAEESQYEAIFRLLLQADKSGRAVDFIEKVRSSLEERGEKGRAASIEMMIADYIILDARAQAAFPADGPPAKEAGAILEAMARLESGDEKGLDGALDRISLHSPCRYWKLLLKGLRLFYESKDAEAAEYFEKIPPGSAAAAPASAFLHLMGRKARESTSRLVDLAAFAERARAALSPPCAKCAPDFRRALELFGDFCLSDGMARAEKLLTMKDVFTEKQKQQLGTYFWSVLVHCEMAPPLDLATRFPHTCRYFNDTKDLARTRALRAEGWTEFDDAAAHWREFAGSLERERPKWLDEKDADLARALVLLRAAQKMKESEGQMWAGPFGFPARRRAPDMEFIEDCLEEALELRPGMRAVYEMAVDAFRKARKGKLGKWLHRMKTAFPGDDEVLVQSLAQDLEGGALVRVTKEIDALLKRQDLSPALSSRLHTCTIMLARKLFAKRRHNEARTLFEALMARKLDDGEVLELTRLKYGCMEWALGNQGQAKALLDEALARIEPPEKGLLAAAVEMRRFNAVPSEAMKYLNALSRLIQAGSLAPDASTVALHMQYLQTDNSSGADIRVVLDLIEALVEKRLSHADFAVTVKYVEQVYPPQQLILEKTIDRALACFPGDMRFLFLSFYHKDCGGRSRSITQQQSNNLERWAEGMRQAGDAEFAGRIHHFLNMCRQCGEEKSRGSARTEEYFEREFDPFGGLPELPRGRPRKPGGIPRADGAPAGNPLFEMCLEFIGELPDPDSPRFDLRVREIFSRLGESLDKAGLEKLRELKRESNRARSTPQFPVPEQWKPPPPAGKQQPAPARPAPKPSQAKRRAAGGQSNTYQQMELFL